MELHENKGNQADIAEPRRPYRGSVEVNARAKPAVGVASASGRLWLVVAGLVFALGLNGAIPFVQMPTLGQAVWTLGFAQSFAENGILSVYATHIGAPMPAPIAFGLSGAWLSSVFLLIGVPPEAAYTLMSAVYLGLSYAACYILTRALGGKVSLAVLAAVVWTTAPIVMRHSGYSMLSLGIALLPFYFLSALLLFGMLGTEDRRIRGAGFAGAALLYISAAILSVFMDGYTFVMFFLLGTITGSAAVVIRYAAPWRAFAGFVVHAAAFGTAYVLYTRYIGQSAFEPNSLDHFRAWGADLDFFVTPTASLHLVPGLIGWGVPRDTNAFFGDASTWETTFALPLLVGALIAVALTRNGHLKTLLILVCLVGLYLSLGPSFKVHSVKPEGWSGPLMPAEYALGPTGTGWLSKTLPGFNNMRASYRWAALGFLGAWALVVLAAARPRSRRAYRIAVALLWLVLVFNLPAPRLVSVKADHYTAYQDMGETLLPGLQASLDPRDRVIFLPWRNDFLVNRLATEAGIRAYNIGGDKNVEMARAHWPDLIRGIRGESVDADLALRILRILAEGEADAVVLMYLDTRWAAHVWPYPAGLETSLAPVETALNESGLTAVDRYEYFAVVRLNSQADVIGRATLAEQLRAESAQSAAVRGQQRKLETEARRQALQDVALGRRADFVQGSVDLPHLYENWSHSEDWGTWSLGSSSSVFFPISTPTAPAYRLEMEFHAYASGSDDCPLVGVEINESSTFSERLCGGQVGDGGMPIAFAISRESIEAHDGVLIRFRTPDAKSPASTGASGDGRELGVGLKWMRLSAAEE